MMPKQEPSSSEKENADGMENLTISSEEAVRVLGRLIRNQKISFGDVESSLKLVRAEQTSIETVGTEFSDEDCIAIDKATIKSVPEGTEAKKVLEDEGTCTKTGNEQCDNVKVSQSNIAQDEKTLGTKGGNTKGSTFRSNKKNVLLESCRYRHIAIRFLYDGSLYNGFAENARSPADNSVEKQFFAALTKTCLIRKGEAPEENGDSPHSTKGRRYVQCQYSRSGRTDRGVSAFGQVIGIRVRSKIPALDGKNGAIAESDLPRNSFESMSVCKPLKKSNGKGSKSTKKRKRQILSEAADVYTEEEEKQDEEFQMVDMQELDYCKILNGVLPETIRCLGWTPVSDEFSARFSARDRTYRYFFVRRKLNLQAMEEGLKRMVGTHDFRNLCKMDIEAVSNFVRVIKYAKVVVQSSHLLPATQEAPEDHERDLCYFEICGQAFLWHMIRCIVSICFMIGKGLEDPSVVTELLDVEKHPGKPSYPMAPDLPLVLHQCAFQNVTFGHSSLNLWEVHNTLEHQWEQAALAAERLRNALDSLQEEAYIQQAEFGSFVCKYLIPFVIGGAKRSRSSDVIELTINEAVAHATDEKLSQLLKQVRQTRVKKCGFNADNKDMTKEAVIMSQVKEESNADAASILSWGEALAIIQELGHCCLIPPASKESTFHVKLFDRNKGTTYEEKIAAMKGKRKERFEANARKQQHHDADKEFYDKMVKEGGRGM